MLLPLYQAIATVTVGNGDRTSFWHDAWIDEEALVDRLCGSLGADDPDFLVSRLSQQAIAELEEARQLMIGT